MKLKILFIALLFSAVSWGQASIATIGTAVTENFNSMTNGTWTDNTTPLTGWYAKTDNTPSISAYGANTGSTTTAGLYAFGVAGTNALTDRALGFANSNAFTGSSTVGKAYMGWRLKNNTGAAISSITVVWSGEQWRKAAVNSAQTLILTYQTSSSAITNLTAGTWTSTGSNFSSPIFSLATATALDGNATANRSTPAISVTMSVTLAAGDEIMLRWEDLNDSGNDHFLAIDDVSVTCFGLTTAIASGAWSSTTTWDTGVVPPANGNVLIPSPFTVHLTGNVTRNAVASTTVAVGGTLATALSGANTNTFINNGTTTINGTFRVEENGSASGNNFIYGATGTLNFNNTAANTPTGKIIVNTDVFWPTTSGPFNVNVIGDITMSAGAPRTVAGTFTTGTRAASGVTTTATSNLTFNGTVRINTNGGFAGPAGSFPIYGNASTLIYNMGVAINRSNEWNATGVGTIGVTPGYPNNVQISGSTTVNYNGAAVARATNGNFTIDAVSTFNMTAATTGNLTVGGSLTNNGILNFSTATTTGGNIIVTNNFSNSGTVAMGTLLVTQTGGNLRVGGDFSNSSVGFTPGNRSIFFTKTGIQTVSSSTALTFAYIYTAGTGTTVQLQNSLTISSPSATINGGVAITFGNAADVIDLNGNSLTIGTGAIANTISGAGSFKGSTTSSLILRGTGSIGTLRFASNLNLGTFTMNRTASAVGCVMGSALTVNTTFNLTAGLIDLGANTMTLVNGVNPTGSISSYVIADLSAGGILNKEVTATGTNYIFPIGSGGTEFAPATVNFSAGSFASAILGMAVENPVLGHPNWSSAASYIRRYWSLTSSGITTPTYDFSATYPAADVVGTIGANYKSNQWDGSDWSNGGIAITSGTISKTGCTLNTGTNHISAAIRDQEIDIRGGGNVILNGATTTIGLNGTAFGTQIISTPSTNTFTIHNRGGINLNLTGGTLVVIGGANPGDFVVTSLPTTPVTAESSTTFQITFTPSYAGQRTATVSIANNDGNENPYTFVINGYGDCSVAASNTITPTSGPPGTEVTITAVTNNLYSATVSINGVAATVSNYSPAMATATVIKAIIPATAVSGPLLTTNNLGCQASNTFTVLDNASTSCEGGLTVPNLFISEVTDATFGGLTYVEIYNGTSSARNLANYALRFYANGGATQYSTVVLAGTLNPGQTYVVSTATTASFCSSVSGGDGSLSDQVTGTAGINFADAATGSDALGHDHIALVDSGTFATIDVWGTYGNQSWATSLNIGDRGVDFRRINTAPLPSTTYNNSHWTVSNWIGSGSSSCPTNDYSDIRKYNFRTGVPPTVSTLSYTPTCKAATISVTATEGYTGSNPLVFSWYAVPNGSNTWSLISDTPGVFSGATSSSLYIHNISSYINYQFYCQVSENTATCYTASNAVKITSSQSTTWQVGNTWSNSPPTINTAVTIDNDYDTANILSPSFDACSLTINNGKTVTIRANDFVNIQNDLTVDLGGNLVVENNGSLVMIDDNGVVTNNGTTQIKRTSTPYERFDYVYWSSPVVSANANIASTFSGWRTDYSFQFDTANFYDVKTINNSGVVTSVVADSFDDYAPWAWQRTTGNMTSGKGYAIMAPTSVTFSPSAPGATVTFSGKVNNGIIPLALVETSNTDAGYVGVNNANDDYNLVGNPYPSAIFANKFIIDNGANTSGTLYFWTHVLNVSNTNPGPNAYNFISDDYALYNMSGGTRASLTSPASSVPTGYIGSGQGFFVEAQSTNNLVFNNSMRSKTYANNQFFRTSIDGSTEKDRLWLNLQNADGLFGQQLIAYFDETTLGFDWGYDGRVNLTNNYVSFYSMAGGEKYKIQARPTFEASDIVPLGYFSAVSGQFTISIDKKEGVFDTDQNVYLEDRDMNIIHDLKQSPYTFTTNFGRYENRFLLRYTNEALSTPDFETLASSVVVATNHGEMTIKSYIENIQEVTVYDVLGRQLFFAKEINNKNFITSDITKSYQALIVKITLENGTIVTRKIIL